MRHTVTGQAESLKAESQRTEQEPLYVLANLQAVFEGATSGIALINTREAPLLVNPALEKMIGYTSIELRSLGFTAITHPDDAWIDRQEYKDLLAGNLDSYQVEKRYIHKKGQVIWVNLSLSLIRNSDGSPQSIIAMMQDIAGSKRIAEDLAIAREEAEHRAAEMESFVASMTDGAVLFDAQGRALWMNKAGREILGADTDESFENWDTRAVRYTLDGELLPAGQHLVSRALEGECSRDLSYRVVTPHGKDIFINTSFSPVWNSEGQIIGATSVFRDVTEQVTSELQRRESYEREHHIADTLQKALVPEVNVEVPGYRIVGDYRPALKEAQVGGDFYDVFKLYDGRLAIVMGDVSGKGLQAAVHTAMAKYMLRAYANENPEPDQVLERLNQAVHNYTSDDTFVTVFYGVLDPTTRILTYANAGHDEPLLQSSSTGCTVPLDLTGRAIGAFPGSTYGRRTVNLSPGDVLLIYTDGITDARVGDRFFGQDGLAEVLAANTEGDEEFIVGAVLAAATEHAGGDLLDDAAVVVIKAKEGEKRADSGD